MQLLHHQLLGLAPARAGADTQLSYPPHRLIPAIILHRIKQNNDLFQRQITGLALLELNKLIRWAGLFPNITRMIGMGTLGVIGIIAALSALSVVVGTGMLVVSGLGLAWAGIGSF
jgi:hypothetical protein